MKGDRMNARDIMCKQVVSCRPDASCQQAAQMLCQKDIGSIPVVDNANIVQGIITDRDICCRVFAAGKNASTPVRDAMSKDIRCVQADSNLEQIEHVMQQYQVRRVPVVDKQNRLQGVIAMADLCHARCQAQQHRELAETLDAVSSPSPVHVP